MDEDGQQNAAYIGLMGFGSMILAIFTQAMPFTEVVTEGPVQGLASLMIVVSFFSGCILTALGVNAECLAVTTLGGCGFAQWSPQDAYGDRGSAS